MFSAETRSRLTKVRDSLCRLFAYLLNISAVFTPMKLLAITDCKMFTILAKLHKRRAQVKRRTLRKTNHMQTPFHGISEVPYG